MQHKYAVDAVNRTIQDLLGNELPFGGICQHNLNSWHLFCGQKGLSVVHTFNLSVPSSNNADIVALNFSTGPCLIFSTSPQGIAVCTAGRSSTVQV